MTNDGRRTIKQARGVRVVVTILLLEQVVVAVVGTIGTIRPAISDQLLQALIVAQILLDIVGLTLVALTWGFRPTAPRSFLWLAGFLCVAAGFKNLDTASGWSVVLDLVRLLVPLFWVALIDTDALTGEFVEQTKLLRPVLILVLATQSAGLVYGRLLGWGGAYLSGDPIVPFLVYPAIFMCRGVLGQAATGSFAVVLVAASLKRTAWITAAFVVVLLTLAAPARLRKGVITRLLALSAIAVIGVSAAGFTQKLDARIATITSVLDQSTPADESIAQRTEEIQTEFTRASVNPIETSVLGLSSQSVILSNDVATHAIHNTPVFLLFGGAVPWVGALLAGRRIRIPSSTSRFSRMLTLVALASLFDSIGGNEALAPSFGIALAIVASRIWPVRSGA